MPSCTYEIIEKVSQVKERKQAMFGNCLKNIVMYTKCNAYNKKYSFQELKEQLGLLVNRVGECKIINKYRR